MERGSTQRGEDVFAIDDKYVCFGGRLMFSPDRRDIDSSGFDIKQVEDKGRRMPYWRILMGTVPPAWNDKCLVFTESNAPAVCCDMDEVANFLSFKFNPGPGVNPAAAQGVTFGGGNLSRNRPPEGIASKPKKRWAAKDATGLEILSLAMAPNAVLTVTKTRWAATWRLMALEPGDGKVIWSNTLPGEPRPNGLMVERNGRIAVTMLDGSVVCYEGCAGPAIMRNTAVVQRDSAARLGDFASA